MAQVKQSSRLASHFVISCVLLMGFVLLSSFINQQNQASLIKSLQATFRNDRDIGNTAYLGRRVADLEAFGLIKCVNVQSPDLGVIYSTEFKSGCAGFPFLESIMDPMGQVNVTSSSGEKFSIRFKSDSSVAYKIYLIIFSGLSLLFINLLVSLYWYRIALKARDLEKEQETNRLLDLKVNQQASELFKIRIEAEIQKSLAEMAKRVAHDIRSPLSVLNAISKKIQGDLPQEGALLSEVSTRIIQIAEGLLDASREKAPMAGASTAPEVIKVLDISSRSGEVLAICKNALEEKRLELGHTNHLSLQFYNELTDPFHCLCETPTLSRIISNLLNNSIEAILGPGFISLTLSRREERLLIEIRDSGQGMSEDLIAQIFKGPTTHGKERGNGLGLWTAIEAARGWGGELHLSSVLGAGTTVTLALPIRV